MLLLETRKLYEPNNLLAFCATRSERSAEVHI
ncbi:unnamed protein product, partial [Rotaria magnacalcarata]